MFITPYAGAEALGSRLSGGSVRGHSIDFVDFTRDLFMSDCAD